MVSKTIMMVFVEMHTLSTVGKKGVVENTARSIYVFKIHIFQIHCGIGP